MARASHIHVDLQTGTDSTIYATWDWGKSHTDHYDVKWYYATGDGLWFKGNSESVTSRQSVYSAPSNSTKVKFLVKPVSDKHKVHRKHVSYWSASWSTEKIYDMRSNPPVVPSTPTVTIENYTLTAEVDDYNDQNSAIEFYVVKDDNTKVTSAKCTKKTNHAEIICTVQAGHEYKVKCRGVDGKESSDWSQYSSSVGTIPSVPKITSVSSDSSTSVAVNWNAVSYAKSYNIEYTTQSSYFDVSDKVTSMSVDSVVHMARMIGLETGNTYYIRVCAVNDAGKSGWSAISSITVGKVPAPPTTWSSKTVTMVGEALTLYWVHNSQDGSSQTDAILNMIINDGTSQQTVEMTIPNTNDEEHKDQTSFHDVDTSSFVEGASIQWKVKTKGVLDEYSDWSVVRTVNVYAPPTLDLTIDQNEDLVTAFPFSIYATVGPETQTPIGYYLTVTAKEAFQDIDDTGLVRNVAAGETIYEKHFDGNANPFAVDLTAGGINLDNNMTYTITLVAAMNSGLSATASIDFTVSWAEDVYEPNAEIGIDDDALVAYIRPYCEDAYGNEVDDVTFSIYRREFDGKMTELATGLDNTKFITDPHPSLDYARYRVVAKSNTTGAISFYDVPGYPVGEPAAVIQWDETWSNFDNPDRNEDDTEVPAWTGSMIRLPYNLDTSESKKPDVALVEYIGRENPVGYYGTQRGDTSSWDVEIVKDDIDTLYALRRLSRYMGNVYVREPSGVGYWANITVSISKKHCALTIPVSISITRVEGGI